MKHIKLFEGFINMEQAKEEIDEAMDKVSYYIEREFPLWKIQKRTGDANLDIHIKDMLGYEIVNNTIYVDFDNLGIEAFINIYFVADTNTNSVYMMLKKVGLSDWKKFTNIFKKKNKYPFDDNPQHGGTSYHNLAKLFKELSIINDYVIERHRWQQWESQKNNQSK